MKKLRNLQQVADRLETFSREIVKIVNAYRNQGPEDCQMSIEDYFPRWKEGKYE